MKFDTYRQYFEVNRPISEVWEEARNIMSSRFEGKVSSIDKLDNDTWYFTFSLNRSLYLRYSLAEINGRVVSLGDNKTKVDVKSNINSAVILIDILFLLIVFFVEITVVSVFMYLLKFSIMATVLFFSSYLYNKEANININEVVKKLNNK